MKRFFACLLTTVIVFPAWAQGPSVRVAGDASARALDPALRARLEKHVLQCWQPRVESASSGLPPVAVRATFAKDGTVRAMTLPEGEKPKYQASPAYRDTSMLAMDALMTCSPMRFLRNKPYDTWKELDFAFGAGAGRTAQEEMLPQVTPGVIIPADQIH